MRFDGGHKRDRVLVDVLGPHVEWVRVCPEVEVGMGTPREALRLVRDAAGLVRMVTTGTGVDHTEAMARWSHARLDRLEADNLDGYVLKSHSPSCGMEGVKVFVGGAPQRTGRGIFAEALIERFPHLPVEEEGRLADTRLRDNFVARLFAYRRLRTLFGGRWTPGSLAAFHSAHEMSLQSHSSEACDRLGRLVAEASAADRSTLRGEYECGFMEAMAIVPTTESHAGVLLRMAEQLDPWLDISERRELRTRIEDYRRGVLTLAAPISLARRHVQASGVARLAGQTYLQPEPREAILRGFV